MKKWMVVASVLALLVCGAALMSLAQEQGPHKEFMGGPGHGPGMGMMLHELNLTDAQKEQVHAIMKANHATMKPLMQQLEQNRAALLAATANGAYDAAKIQALATQQAQLQAAMIVNHESIQHQIYTQVLSSEQQAKAEQLRSDEIKRINERLQKIANGAEKEGPAAQ